MGFHLVVSAYWVSMPTVADMVIVIGTSDGIFLLFDDGIGGWHDVKKTGIQESGLNGSANPRTSRESCKSAPLP